MKTLTGINRYLGLMFRTSKTEPVEIVFNEEVHTPIHSWFVFFDFMCYWYNDEGELIQSRLVRPFESNINCDKPFKTIMEFPVK